MPLEFLSRRRSSLGYNHEDADALLEISFRDNDDQLLSSEIDAENPQDIQDESKAEEVQEATNYRNKTIQFRLEHGECTSCGNKTHDVFRTEDGSNKLKPRSVSGLVNNGICLICNPREATIPEEEEREKETEDEKEATIPTFNSSGAASVSSAPIRPGPIRGYSMSSLFSSSAPIRPGIIRGDSMKSLSVVSCDDNVSASRRHSSFLQNTHAKFIQSLARSSTSSTISIDEIDDTFDDDDLSSEEEDKIIKLIDSARNIECVIGHMKDHPSSSRIQKEACESLRCWSLTDKPMLSLIFSRDRNNKNGNYQNDIRNSDGITAILSAMKKHLHFPELQREACLAISHLCCGNDCNKHFICDNGGITTIVNSMKSNPDDVNVQEQACFALWNLSSPNDERKDVVRDIQIRNEGGVGAIHVARHLHVNVESLQKCANVALDRLLSYKK